MEHLMVEQWNTLDGTVDYLMLEQWHRDRGIVETVDHRMVEQSLLNSGTSDGGTEIVEQWNI